MHFQSYRQKWKEAVGQLRQVRFDAPSDLIDAVDEMIEDLDYSRSAWIRKLLRDSLQRQKETE